MLNKLYKLGVPTTKRDDLVAVLGTGIPKVTFTGNDLRRRAADQPLDPGRRRTRTGWACSAATTPASRTAAGSATTSSTSRSRPSPASSRARRCRSATASTRNDMPLPGALPVRGDAAPGLRELEGDAARRRPTRGPARGAGPHRPPGDTSMTNKLLIASPPSSPPASPRSSAACSPGRAATPPDALAASQSVEDFKAGFALNASTRLARREPPVDARGEPEGRAHAGCCSGSPTSSAPARPATRPTTRSPAARSTARSRSTRKDSLVVSGLGSLALSRHRFALGAAARPRRRTRSRPTTARNYGVIGDAEIELGRYRARVPRLRHDEPAAPSLSSYARVSYGRELIGHTAAAIEAMKLAVDAADRHRRADAPGRTSSSASSTSTTAASPPPSASSGSRTPIFPRLRLRARRARAGAGGARAPARRDRARAARRST